MKPPSTAILYKLKDGDVGEIDLDTWRLLSNDPPKEENRFRENRYLPLLLHIPTGLLFTISMDYEHSPDALAVFAVFTGQHLDEFNNMRKIGKIAVEKYGRCAIKAYLVAAGMWQDFWTPVEAIQ